MYKVVLTRIEPILNPNPTLCSIGTNFDDSILDYEEVQTTMVSAKSIEDAERKLKDLVDMGFGENELSIKGEDAK